MDGIEKKMQELHNVDNNYDDDDAKSKKKNQRDERKSEREREKLKFMDGSLMHHSIDRR